MVRSWPAFGTTRHRSVVLAMAEPCRIRVEAYALVGAQDITHLGGLAALSANTVMMSLQCRENVALL